MRHSRAQFSGSEASRHRQSSAGCITTTCESEFSVHTRNTPMNEDRLTGTAKNVGGQVEEGFGRATGDVKTQLQGKAKQMEGALQDAYGEVKETAASAAEAISKRASAAEDVLRTTIEQRPYTTAAIALGIGYLIGRFGRRADD